MQKRKILFSLFAVILALGVGTPEASPASPCKGKDYVSECKAIKQKIESKLCRPSDLYILSPEDATHWIEAMSNAAALEARATKYIAKYGHCTEKRTNKCKEYKSVVAMCTGLKAKYDKAWGKKVKWARQELARVLKEVKSRKDPKSAYKALRAYQRDLVKNLYTVLWVEPNHTEFKKIEAQVQALRKKYRSANLDEISKVQCPKGARKRNKGLEKKLLKVYQPWLSRALVKQRAKVLRQNKPLVKKTDVFGTKWEYAYTVTCVEELADPKDPARCSVNEISFKRSKRKGKKWSAWTVHGAGGRHDAMLCKKIK